MDNKEKLYKALSEEYDLGTFEQFSADLDNEEKRRKLYDATSDDYDYGDYESFSAQLGYKEPFKMAEPFDMNKANEESLAGLTAPQQQAYVPSPSTDSQYEGQVPVIEQAPRRGFIAGAQESWKGLKAGTQFAYGEVVNGIFGSSQDDANALYELNEMLRQGKDVASEVEGAWTDAGREIRTGALEFLPGWAIKGLKDRVYKEAEHQKILDDIREVLGETNGDVAKARQILEERAMDLSHGDRVKLDAQRQFGNIRETEGFGAWLGENTVQMIPSASALIVGALTKSPAAARAIGMIGMGGMTAATSGSSMYEAREAGASDLETHKVGVVDGAIEYITEKLPFDNYTNWMVGKTKGKVATEVARALRSKNSPVRAEMEELLTMANKELGGKLFSKKNAAAYIADMVAEGASEFTAEASQTMTRLMYDNPDLFPLLGEALANGWQGALAGFFMGGVLGGASKTMEHHQNRERRQKQGYVDVGLVNFGTAENPDNDIVEVISVSEDTDLAQVLRDGAIINVNKNAIGQQYRYSYEAFEAGRMRVLESEALDNESVTQGMIQAADSREATAEQNLVEALRASGMADDEIMTLLEDADADKIRMFDSPDIENAYNIYKDARHRARELRRTSARQAQSALNLKRLSIEENAGQFWRDNQTEDANGNPIFNPTVETGLMQDGTRVYVLSDVNEQGECAAVTENGEKKIIKADMLQDGTQVFTLDEYLQSLVDADKVQQEQTRMVEQTQDRMTQARQAAQPGTQINLGTEEDPVIGSIVEQGPDGVIVQSEAGASQLTWDEYANAMHIGAPALTDNETAGVEAAEILSAESAYNNEVAQTESEAKEVADESGAALQEFEQADPLPRDAEGNVDETTLWNDSPARWAEWNDEQRQDGGANSIQAIDAAVAKLSATIAEQQAAYGAMPVGKERNAVEQEIASLQERLAELLNVQQRYVAPVAEEVTETAAEAPASEVAEEPAVEAANPVRETLTQLYNDPELSESEIEAFINANVQESQKALDKHLDKAPKMGTDMAKYKADRAKHQAKTAELEKQRDFWREVQSYIEMPDVTEMDMEPQNALEFTANELTRKDGVKLQRDSFTRHTGYGSEAGNFLSMLRTKQNGGLTLEEAGERLMEMDRENGTRFFDQSDPNAGLNAILEVIGGARTSGDVSGYIKANREQLAREEMAAARNAMMEEMIQEETAPAENIIDNVESDLPEDIFMRTVDETEAIGGAATVKGRAEAWEKRLGIKVNVLEDVSQVKNRAIRKAIERGLQAPGWFDRATGEVCIYAPQIPNMSEVDKTVIHEVISHKGLRGLLGEEGFNALCDYVWQNMKPEARAKYLTYEGVLKGERKAEYSANPEAFIPTEKESRAAADEFIAGYSESMNTDKNAWQKMIDSVKRFINKLTGNYSLVDQLDELLEASLARYETIAKMDLQGVVEEGQTYGGIIDAETGAKIDASSDIQAEGEDARFRITPEMDAEYLRAVEAGDMEAAQRMVNEAAKLAMPNTLVVDENGNPKVVYHGSTAMFTVFDKSRIGSATGTADGRGFYFTTDRDYALGYKTSDGQLFEVFLNIEKPLSYDKKTITKSQLRKILKEADRVEYEQEGEHYMLSNYANYYDVGIDAAVNEAANLEYDYADNDVELVGSLIGGSGSFDLIMDAVKKVTGKSGMIAPKDNGTVHYVVTNPAAIKAADPVTYDDNGNVIPLSERFSPENEDIRFRVANENQAIFVSNAARAVEGIKQEKATPEQWLKMIEKNGGLKAGEDKWMGLSDWLKASDKKTLTKAEVLDFINENMIVIEEQHYGEFDYIANLPYLTENFPGYDRAFDFEYDERRDKPVVYFTDEEEAAKFYNEHHSDKVEFDEENGLNPFDWNKVEAFGLELAELHYSQRVKGNIRPVHDTRTGYVTRGLENLHEIALTVPTIESWNTSDDIHFGDAGDGRAVAWVRFGDAMKLLGTVKVDGKKKFNWAKVLVIDEIQSKRHQEGREKGYRTKEDDELVQKRGVAHWEMMKKYNVSTPYELKQVISSEDAQYLESLYQGKKVGEIPDAPFDKNWHELAMKRMLRYAAENGYDVIAWTKGEQQADRYNVGGIIVEIKSTKYPRGYEVVSFGNNGSIVHNAVFADESAMAGVYGKEMAKRIIESVDALEPSETATISGDNLRIGGEGMKGFYDKMLPAFMNKYGKKWGVKVEDINLPGLANGLTMHSVPVTEEMKASVMEGQVMFRVRGENESAMDFHQSMVDDFLAKYNPNAEVLVFPVNEDTAKRFGYTLDELNDVNGIYVPDEDIIAIFAHEDETDGDEVENTLFHESIHKLATFYPYMRQTGKWMLDNADQDGVLSDYKAIIDEDYLNFAAEDQQEEMLTHVLSGAMAIGQVDRLFRYLPASERDICEQILNEIEYDRERESRERIGRSYQESEMAEADSVSETSGESESQAQEADSEGLSFRVTDITPEVSAEMNTISAIALVNGTYLKAPNGADTNLTPEQWALVRTKNFLRWFGDWINDPENASKVVDENGEPKVVYHGSATSGITAFDKSRIRAGETDANYNGFWFSTDEDTLPAWVRKEARYDVFLKLVNPISDKEAEIISKEVLLSDKDYAGARSLADATRFELQSRGYDGVLHQTHPDIDFVKLENDGYVEFETSRGARYLIERNPEGVYEIYRYSKYEEDHKGAFYGDFDTIEDIKKDPYFFGEEIYVVFEPSQIKSATDNTGEFSDEDGDIRYRISNDSETGIESLVERTFRTSGAFSFSGKEKIESRDDVAFIFKQLEDSAIENSFLVFVKDGIPTVIHVGMGGTSYTMIDNSVVLPAYKDFGADKIYMVHNHPSGSLYASKADLDSLKTISMQIPDVSVEGIIINTVSGEYASFDLSSSTQSPIPTDEGTVPVKVLSFDKNVFAPDYKSKINERKIKGSDDVASFLSAHRLGEGTKVGALLLNRQNMINGNLVTNDNEVSVENADTLASQIAEAANRTGSSAVILFGDFDYSDRAVRSLSKGIKRASGNTIDLLDVVRLEGNHTLSLADETLPSRSTLGDGIRFRTREEAQELLNLMQENAETLIPRQLTEDIWKEEIEGRTFSSPIGTVRLGHNQFDKNINKGRAREFGMLIPTIERPDLIFEESAPEEGAERQTKYVFVKTFIDESGAKHINYASISVQKEGMEVVESSHRLRDKQVLNKIEKEQMLWNRFASDSTSSAPGISTDQSNALSDNKDSDNLDTSNDLDENISYRITGTPTEQVVAEGVSFSPADMARVAGRIFSVLPEEARREVTASLNGNILGLQDAIMQIPARLAMKQDWDEQDMAVAEAIAAEMDRITPDKTRPFSTYEGLWMLYDALTPASSLNLMDQASRAIVKRNLGVDEATLERMKGYDDDVRFRTVGDATINAEASLYNKGASYVWTRLKESFVDMNASVEKLVKAIEKKTGMKAQGFENILNALNQQSSKGLAAMKGYTRTYLKPMFKAIREIMDNTDFKYEDIVRHVILKHGLERNRKLAQRDARAHYQEIYDDIITKIKGLSDAQKRTYLTNAQLRDADAKAELAGLQNVNTSILTDEQKREHKRDLAKARKAVEEAAEYLERAKKIASLSEQEAQDELDKIFENIENGTDSVYQELRKNDYSGISSMFYDQLGVNRKDYSTEEQYQSALMLAKDDRYSTLADVEAAAEAEVKTFEGTVSTEELWKRINAATKETLRQQYEANMISRDQYESLRNMFEYYVPLRGFKDNTAEDMYTYYRRPNSTGYTKPILGAEGRKTEAESPFGWIAAMAGSAVASNVKNQAKLALYYFVSNRPENGIATLSRTWFVDSGEVDADGRKVFKPAYPPFTEDLSSDAAKASYEAWQENMRELQKKGQAYESGQRLNLGNAVVNISDANKPEHIVNVKVAGKDYTILINGNPRAAQAINGQLNIEASAQDYTALFGPVLRWMSSVNTSYNPEFWITNMMRDMLFTFMSVNTKEDAAYRRKFAKNYLKAFKVVKMVHQNEKGTIGDSYLENMYKEFEKNGGVTGYTQIKGSEEWEKEIAKQLASEDPEGKKAGKMMRKVMDGFSWFHRTGESLEQVSRFAAFLTAREMGKPMSEAIDDAKEITVNFNRKGSGKRITFEEARYLTDKNGQPLNAFQQWMAVGLSSIAPLGRRTIMFFNAAMQGLNATAKLVKKNPQKMAAWSLAYFAIGVMNAVLHNMFDDDDDYLDMPEYERRNALMLGGNGVYFKWALPQEMRMIYGLGDLAVEAILGRNPHESTLVEAVKIVTEVLPINPTEGWRAFLPSVAIPFVELGVNEDYKGDPIYNEQKWLSEGEKERTAKWSSAYKSTGRVYIEIAKALNSFTDGSDLDDAGLVNLQPEKLEYLVQSAFGGTVRTADKFVSSVINAIDPEESMTVRQFPFLNRVLTLNDERYKNVHVNDVFEWYENEVLHAISLEKKFKRDKQTGKLEELKASDEYKWIAVYIKYEKDLKLKKAQLKAAPDTRTRMELTKAQDEIKKRVIKEISAMQ